MAMADLASLASDLYSWCIFLAVVACAWDGVLVAAVKETNDAVKQLPGAGAPPTGPPLTRAYVVVIVLFALCKLVLGVMVFMVAVFAVATVFSISSKHAKLIGDGSLRVAMLWVSDPTRVFHSIERQHLPFHATIIGVCAVFAAVLSVWYVNDKDLQHNDLVRAKVLRILMSTGSIMAQAYLFYAGYRALQWLSD